MIPERSGRNARARRTPHRAIDASRSAAFTLGIAFLPAGYGLLCQRVRKYYYLQRRHERSEEEGGRLIRRLSTNMTARLDGENARRWCATIALLAASQIATAQEDVYVDAGRGPVRVHVPAAYSDGVPSALVIELHGRWSSGEEIEEYLQFEPVSDQRGFLLALPDGGANDRGVHFWNATDACHGEPDV